jgi:hypothetical protein
MASVSLSVSDHFGQSFRILQLVTTAIAIISVNDRGPALSASDEIRILQCCLIGLLLECLEDDVVIPRSGRLPQFFPAPRYQVARVGSYTNLPTSVISHLLY